MHLEELQQALSDLPTGPLHFFDSIGSTNDEAARRVEQGAPELTLVIADEQTAGRGRFSRRWHTPPGSALAFSVVLRPELEHTAAVMPNRLMPRYTALGALAAAGALRRYDLAPQIKWPNDVLLEGTKVAGILAEALWQGDRLMAVILGIGVNVSPAAVPPEGDTLFPATCVETVLGEPVDRIQLLYRLLKELIQWRPLLESQHFLNAWLDLLAYRGEWVRISGAAPEASEQGLVLGLSESGALQLQTREGSLIELTTGEVSLRPLDNSA